METNIQKLIIVAERQGKVLNVMGETITLKVTGDETNGAYSVVEQSSAGRGSVARSPA